jgi:hypothetical protein
LAAASFAALMPLSRLPQEEGGGGHALSLSRLQRNEDANDEAILGDVSHNGIDERVPRCGSLFCFVSRRESVSKGHLPSVLIESIQQSSVPHRVSWLMVNTSAKGQ